MEVQETTILPFPKMAMSSRHVEATLMNLMQPGIIREFSVRGCALNGEKWVFIYDYGRFRLPDWTSQGQNAWIFPNLSLRNKAASS